MTDLSGGEGPDPDVSRCPECGIAEPGSNVREPAPESGPDSYKCNNCGYVGCWKDSWSASTIREEVEWFLKEWLNERTDRPEDMKEFEMSPEKAFAVEKFAEDLQEVFQDR